MKKTLLLASVALLCQFSKAQNSCSKIDTTTDEFRNLKIYSTPYFPDDRWNIWFSKIIENTKKGKITEYYLYLREMEPVGKTVNGAFVILENGKRISRPNQEISLDVDKEEVSLLHPGYIQEAIIKLTPADVAILKTSPIAKYALSYLKDDYKGEELYQMFLCLSGNKNPK